MHESGEAKIQVQAQPLILSVTLHKTLQHPDVLSSYVQWKE